MINNLNPLYFTGYPRMLGDGASIVADLPYDLCLNDVAASSSHLISNTNSPTECGMLFTFAWDVKKMR